MNWKQYVHDITTFRAHDWWGLFLSIIILLFIMLVNYNDILLFWELFVVFVLVLAVFVDINAHEFYH